MIKLKMLILLNYMLKVCLINRKIKVYVFYFIDNKRPFQKPTIIQEFSDIDVSEDLSFTLKCKFDQGYPKARILWYKENTLIQPNDHHRLCK
jgi:hypothetical protein